jgi:hypothetical protein
MVLQLQSYQVSLAFSIFSGGFGTGSFVNPWQGEAHYSLSLFPNRSFE